MASLDVTVGSRWRPLRRLRRRVTPFTVVSALVALLLAFIAVYPLGRTLVRIFVVDGHFDLSGIERAYQLHGFFTMIKNTLIVVLASSGFGLLIGSTLAWLNERTDARLGFVGDALPLISFLVPPIAGAVGWVLLLSPGAGFVNVWLRDVLGWFGVDRTTGPLEIYSFTGLILVYTIYQVPYAFMLVSAGLRSLDPSLEEQSRVSGAGLLRTLRKVTLPAVTPSLAGASVLMAWSGFAYVSMPLVIAGPAGIDILSGQIVQLLTRFPADEGAAIGLSLIMIAFIAIPWYLQGLVLRRGHFAAMAGKHRQATPIRLGRWRWPVRGAVFLYIGITTVLPVFALVVVSLEGYWSAEIPWGKLDIDSYRATFAPGALGRDAIANSLKLSVVVATVGVAAAAIVSLFLVRTSPRLGRFIDAAIKFPPTLSHLVLAVGILIAFGGAPFNLVGTTLILMLAYLSLYYPQTAVAADSAVGQVGRELWEASRVSGAGEWRTFRRIYAPLMMSGLAVGWAMLFARCVGDLTASSILAGPGNPVVGWQILKTFLDSSFADMAALATTLTAMSTLVVGSVLVLARFHGRRSSR